MCFSQFRYYSENICKTQEVNMVNTKNWKNPVFLGVRVSIQLMKEIKKTCKKENIDQSELTRRALAAYLLK